MNNSGRRTNTQKSASSVYQNNNNAQNTAQNNTPKYRNEFSARRHAAEDAYKRELLRQKEAFENKRREEEASRAKAEEEEKKRTEAIRAKVQRRYTIKKNIKHGISSVVVDNRKVVKRDDMVIVRGGIDIHMLIIIILLLTFGTLMVFSASFPYALQETGDSYYYVKKQLMFGGGGFVIMLLASQINYKWYRILTPAFYAFVCALLLAVLMFGVAQGKALRWIYIGNISVQPSELGKLAVTMILAWFYDRYSYRMQSRNFWYSSLWGNFIPLVLLGVIIMLVALEKHFSGIIIIGIIGAIVIFASGARKIWFAIFGTMGGGLILLAIQFVDYAKERLDIFLHPENYSALDETWQTIQGVYAIGSGGIFGVGFGNSTQKYMYVSQPQNDFIFSIICEELGIIGALATIALFAAFVWRGIVIALRAPDTFSTLTVIGIVGQIAVQSILNMMVVTNMIPNTGITLPFFSYGGTALLVLLAEMGVLLCISKYSLDKR